MRRSLNGVALALFSAIAAFTAMHAAPPQDDLVAACRRGDLASAQRLLKAGTAINGTDREGRTPLLAALFSRKEELVAWLLKNGADPNLSARCPEELCPGHPSLIFSIYLREPRLVTLLLDAKADVADNDHAPARQANTDGSVEILRILRAAGGRETGTIPAQPGLRRNSAGARPAPFGLSKLLPAGPASTRKAGAKLRVAIVAGDALRPSADLLAASLAGAPFDLFERGELQRVLDEHKLTSQLGSDGTRAAELGALLGADALILLRKVQLGETASVEMRFVRVSPGIVLDSAYRAWPLTDASAWATDATARLSQLDPKLRDDHAIAVATAPFRPLTDTPAAASLARETLLLINDRLAHQPGLVLLERESVDLIAREQGIGKAGVFWAGSYSLDGTVEPSANDAAQTAITLRLAPIGAGEAKAFTVRGPRNELPRLASELVAQAAAALKLRAAPPSDLKGEAQRYFDESRNLFAIGLPLPAYRAAATAAAFGLDSEEFIEWRLETALRLLSWQTLKLAENSRFEPLRWNGWSESWIEARMDGAEWLHPTEWIDLGVDTIRLWQWLLLPALSGDDADRAAALLARNESIVGGAFAVFHSMNLAATALGFHDAHLAIPQAVRETLEQALALADAKPAHAANASTIAVKIANLAGALYRDKASLVTAFTPLLARDFLVENAGTRVAIRRALFSLDVKTNVQFMAPSSEGVGQIALLSSDIPTAHAPAARAALRKAVSRGAVVEDELTHAAFDYFEAQSAKQQRASSEKLFDLFWQRRQFFVDVPSAVQLMTRICALVSESGGDAPKFAGRSGGPEGPPETTPEMRKLRRDLFVLIAKNAAHPGPAMELVLGDFQPPGKDVAEIAALSQRVFADAATASSRSARPRSAPATPAQMPRPVSPTAPTYAKCPPLKVTRRWTAPKTPNGPRETLRISAPAFDPEANALWLFGESEVSLDEKSVHSYAFEISLPSLKTTAWALPEFQRVHLGTGSIESDAVHILPQRDFIYLAKDEEFLAIGNRKTRQWKLSREVQPFGEFLQVGGELYFLTRGGGARGMSSISLRDQSIAVLASNRRTPQQTPLDRPDIAAVSLKAGANGLIEITTEPFDPTNVAPSPSAGAKPKSLLIFDPSTRNWTEPTRIEASPSKNDFAPLIAAGTPKAYKQAPESNVWTLQLPRESTPKVRLPITFVPPTGSAPAHAVEAMMFGKWHWVPQGYFFILSPPFAGSLVYFIPQAELDAYLDGHKPDEDESSVAPPAPGKKPNSR